MSNHESDWFVIQSAASIERLARTPASMLGPTGRVLRDLAARRQAMPKPELGLVTEVVHDPQARADLDTSEQLGLPLISPVD